MKHLPLFLAFILLPSLSFSQIQWSEQRTVASGIGFLHQVCSSDFDGDGDPDLAVASSSNNRGVYWLENLGQNEFTTHAVGNDVYSPRSVFSIDLDQDGDEDILAADRLYHGKILWWENDGSGSFTQHLVYGELDGAESVYVADLDNDADLDILGVASGSACPEDISWWENDGDQNFTMHVIDPDFTYASDITAADIDLDGDLDVIATAGYYEFTGGIGWWENHGLGEFERHIIQDDYFRAGNPLAADMNGDEIIDILARAGDLNSLGWWAGDGTPANGGWEYNLVSDTYTSARGMEVPDIDGDGVLDILGCAWIGDKISWWRNSGTGVFTEYVIANYVNSPTDVLAVDLDGDGDLDVVATLSDEQMVVWWENLGSPWPVQLTMIPQTSIIPPEGGELLYDVQLTSDLPVTIPGLTFWTSIELPNGQIFSPLSGINFTHTPNMEVYATGLVQAVPSLAMPGVYTFFGNIGFNYDPLVQHHFTFMKHWHLLNSPNAFYPADWKATTPTDFMTSASNGSDLTAQPSGFKLSDAWPNPFNPSTKFRVELPESADLMVRVFNVTGQQVLEVTNGTFSAGVHTFTVNGSGISAGVYFVMAETESWQGMQKVVYLK
jgi:FG-GAP-like repeat/Secretion system C-terminal sorting domain